MEQGTIPERSVDLVYSEVRELLRRQESKLVEARGRAGITLAVAAFALSFLGGSILERGDLGDSFWIGSVSIAFGILCALWVLTPSGKPKLLFSPEPKDLLDHYLPLPPDMSKEYLATYMAGWVEENERQVDLLFTGLRFATVTVGVGIVVLLAELGGVL
ncbi:MAG: hypothetical protein WD473_12110 [Acidimicrobiia bacterium]